MSDILNTVSLLGDQFDAVQVNLKAAETAVIKTGEAI